MSEHKATVTPRKGDPIYWSDLQISCEVDGWRSFATSYAQQVADYQRHKHGQ